MPTYKTRFVPKSGRHPDRRATDAGTPYYGTGLSDNVHITSVGAVNPEIYGSSLQSYCRYVDRESSHAELAVKADHISSHLNDTLSQCADANAADDGDDDDRLSTYSTDSQRWHCRQTRAKYNGSLDSAKRDYFTLDHIDDRSDAMSEDSISGYCYLCTTLEEHRQHLKTEKKIRGQKLRPYENPVRPEDLPSRPFASAFQLSGDKRGKDDVIYKVVVKTGKELSCGTDAQVTFRMFGEGRHQKTKKMALRKPGNRYAFMRGMTDTFSITAPNFSLVSLIEVETDGYEKNQSWFLESVEITNMKTKKLYYFPCFDWLSLYHKGESLSRILEAAEKEELFRDYEVNVVTGQQKHSGTDSKVFLTLVGNKGRRSKKFQLTKSKEHCFQRGAVNRFKLRNPDIGNLAKIRIEHDGRGKSRRWLLLLVLIKDLHSKRQHMFYCNQWLVDEEGNALWREINASKVPKGFDLGLWSSERASGEEVLYEVSVHTGDVSLAGTDANVFIQLYSSDNQSDKINLSEIRGNYEDPFERNQTDIFQVKAKDVGEIKKIRIGHDNKGMAAGWYLEKVVVRKFVEVRKRVPVEEEKEDKKKKEEKKKKSKDSDSESSSSSESEEDSDEETEKEDKSEKAMKREAAKSKRRQSQTSVTSSIRSATNKLFNLSTVDSDKDSDDQMETGMSSKNKSKSKPAKSKSKKSQELSDLNEVSELSSDDTSIWDSEEMAHVDKGIKQALRLKKQQDAISKTMEKIEARVEEYTFIVKQWFASNESDGKIERISRVDNSKKYTRSDSGDSSDSSADSEQR